MSTMIGLKTNIGLKLLAVFLAAAFWYAATPDREGGEILAVPVVLENVPPHLAVAGAPQVVRMTVAGPASSLMLQEMSKPTAVLDLQGLGPGTVSFDSRGAVRLGRGLRVVRIQPATIELRLTARE